MSLVFDSLLSRLNSFPPLVLWATNISSSSTAYPELTLKIKTGSNRERVTQVRYWGRSAKKFQVKFNVKYEGEFLDCSRWSLRARYLRSRFIVG